MAERLTEYDSHGDVYVKHHDYISAAEKLARYEDLEEQGRLIELPCKVGDTVWSFVYETIICGEVIAIKYEIEVENYGTSIGKKITIDFSDIDGEFEATVDFQDFGKKVFLTKEEVEIKLKEMKGSTE